MHTENCQETKRTSISPNSFPSGEHPKPRGDTRSPVLPTSRRSVTENILKQSSGLQLQISERDKME